MKLMVDISSSSGEELSSASPLLLPCPCIPDEHAPPHRKWRLGPPKRVPGPTEVTRAFQPMGSFVGVARKATQHRGQPRQGCCGAPSIVLGWPSLGDGAYWGFAPKTRDDAKGQNISRSIPPCPKHLFPPQLSVSLGTATMMVTVSIEKNPKTLVQIIVPSLGLTFRSF